MIIKANGNVDILSGNYNTLLFGLMVKFGLLVRPYSILNSSFRFSIIQPSGFGLMDPPCSPLKITLKPVLLKTKYFSEFEFSIHGTESLEHELVHTAKSRRPNKCHHPANSIITVLCTST